MAERDRANLAAALNDLAPKSKTPASARVLNGWIAQAQDRLGSAGPRLGWLVAAIVVSAALQRAVDESGVPLFLLKRRDDAAIPAPRHVPHHSGHRRARARRP